MKRARIGAVIGIHALLALACGGDDGDTGAAGDTGAGPDTDAGDTDTDAGDTDTDTDGGTGSEEVLTVLADPCEGAGTPYALTFADAQEGWVGCGNGVGLWHTTDGGDSFAQGHPSSDLYVYQVDVLDSGDVLVCGHDYDHVDGALLYRHRDGAWTDLLRYGNNADDDTAVYMSNCGALATPGDDRMVVASLTAGDITWSEDGGATWSKEERYWEDDNFDGYSYYYLLEMETVGDGWVGAGSKIDEPPVFFGASGDERADWYHRDAVVIDDGLQGEVWSLASPDGGATWFAGGRDQAASATAAGFLYRSDDGGLTWTGGRETLAGIGEGELDIVHDIAFSADGRNGVAVGHRYPPTSQGGFVIVTTDGGDSWQAVDEDVPILQSAEVVGTTFWVAGDAFLARGSFADL